MLKFHRKKHRTWTLNLHRKKSRLLNNQCWIGALGPGALDIWDPRKWKGLLLRGTPRIPNHRAPNHPFTIGWTFSPPKNKDDKKCRLKFCSPSSTSTLIYIYPFGDLTYPFPKNLLVVDDPNFPNSVKSAARSLEVIVSHRSPNFGVPFFGIPKPRIHPPKPSRIHRGARHKPSHPLLAMHPGWRSKAVAEVKAFFNGEKIHPLFTIGKNWGGVSGGDVLVYRKVMTCSQILENWGSINYNYNGLAIIVD